MTKLFRWPLTCTAAFILLLVPLEAHAATPAETLEKGIYNEETTGNLDEAIKHYRQVIAEAKKTESLAAQAQFRLGRCLLKLGRKKEAEEAFLALIKNYPGQADLVAKARKLLPASLELIPAPWKDGERLTFTMSLAGGTPIGLLGTAVSAVKRDGADVWQMHVRRYIVGDTNTGVSSVVVDRKTNLPIATDWDHSLLGTATAKWSAENISITQITKEGKTETKTVRLESPAYSNDQWMFGFRQLPLKIGYKVTVPVRVAFTGGTPIGIEVEVAEKEEIKTPVGTFECFRLDTNIAQTFWITDTPQRYIARFDAGGVNAYLTAIESGEPVELKNEKLDFAVTKPGGWFHYQTKPDNEETAGGFRLVAPTSMVSVAFDVRNKSLLESAERESLDGWADGLVQRLKNNFKDAKERENSRKKVSFADATGLTMILDFVSGGRTMVGTGAFAFKGERAIELALIGDAKQIEIHQEAFEAIRKSVTVK